MRFGGNVKVRIFGIYRISFDEQAMKCSVTYCASSLSYPVFKHSVAAVPREEAPTTKKDLFLAAVCCLVRVR